MPRVSVLTPIYNTNPEHLRAAIESVLNQTFTDFEFIILNDSPDNQELDKIVKSYKDKRIKYIKNEYNMGISGARNKLVEMANGEYIAIFDHDDVSMPTRLEQEVDFLDKNPDVGVVSGFMELFGERAGIRTYPEYDADIKMHMTDNCSVSHSACMIRKSVMVENNIWYEGYYSPSEDYRLFARLMEHTLVYNIQGVLIKYRFFAGNTTHVQAARMARAHDEIQTYVRNKFWAYYVAYQRNVSRRTLFRFKLFGIIPLFKVKNHRVYLFNFIPVCRLMWS